jgi:hypothetical protein
MNKYLNFAIATLAIFAASTALARDSVQQFSIEDVLNKPENVSRLAGVSFYFGDQQHPSISKDFGVFKTNKKTNAFNKTDLEACNWAMASALLQLHQRAQSLGANAVINIKSNYNNNEVSSTAEFTCGAGNTVAGVALIGTVVNIE